MAKKVIVEKDVTSYKWVKIVQAILLIVFGIVLCVFSNSHKVQDALGYITASIILLYGLLTIGFGMIFKKGIFSSENVIGSAVVALSVLIYVSPDIVLTYIPTFSGVMLLVFGLIFLIETFIAANGTNRNISQAILFGLASLLLIVLGSLTLGFKFGGSAENREIINMAIIILIGIILMLVGILNIIYFAANPKYQVKSKTVISNDGKKRYTIVEGENTVVETKDKKPRKSSTKKITKKDSVNSTKNELEPINNDNDKK